MLDYKLWRAKKPDSCNFNQIVCLASQYWFRICIVRDPCQNVVSLLFIYCFSYQILMVYFDCLIKQVSFYSIYEINNDFNFHKLSTRILSQKLSLKIFTLSLNLSHRRNKTKNRINHLLKSWIKQPQKLFKQIFSKFPRLIEHFLLSTKRKAFKLDRDSFYSQKRSKLAQNLDKIVIVFTHRLARGKFSNGLKSLQSK